MPGPEALVFESVVSAFEPDIPHIEAASPFDVCSFDEIILINVIAHSPYDACSRSFGFGFGTKFHDPFAALIIVNVDLLGSAFFIATHEGKFAGWVWSACRPARS